MHHMNFQYHILLYNSLLYLLPRIVGSYKVLAMYVLQTKKP